MGTLIKMVTYPLGNNYKPNKDRVVTDVSNIITKPTELRKLLTDNVFISDKEDDRINQIDKGIELCYNSDKLLKQLKTDDDNINIMRANQLRKKIIKVDEFNEIIH